MPGATSSFLLLVAMPFDTIVANPVSAFCLRSDIKDENMTPHDGTFNMLRTTWLFPSAKLANHDVKNGEVNTAKTQKDQVPSGLRPLATSNWDQLFVKEHGLQ